MPEKIQTDDTPSLQELIHKRLNPQPEIADSSSARQVEILKIMQRIIAAHHAAIDDEQYQEITAEDIIWISDNQTTKGKPTPPPLPKKQAISTPPPSGVRLSKNRLENISSGKSTPDNDFETDSDRASA